MLPRGEWVDLGTHRLMVRRAGTGGPAVIFDAALGASSLSWALVQPEIARETLTVSYDRAGLGGSAAGPMPRTAGRIVEELRRMLDKAGVGPPFVLVGHSYGGLCARLFAERYRSDMAGLVLVDAPEAKTWARPGAENAHRLRMGTWLARRGALAARLGVARAVAWMARAGALGAARAVSNSFSAGALRGHTDHLLAPLAKLPPDLQRAAQEAWLRPRFYEALASQMETLPESAAEAAGAGGLGDLPLAVVTAARPGAARMAEQEAAARQSSQGRHWIAASGGHWIPLDEPETVVAAIREVLAAGRARQAASGAEGRIG